MIRKRFRVREKSVAGAIVKTAKIVGSKGVVGDIVYVAFLILFVWVGVSHFEITMNQFGGSSSNYNFFIIMMKTFGGVG